MNAQLSLNRAAVLALLAAALLLTACGGMEVGLETPGLPTAENTTAATATVPAAQPTAATPPATNTAPPSPAPSPGSVSGRICYPSEFIPAMTAYFENTASGEVTELEISEGQSTYSLDLPAGTYTAFSWRGAYRVGGAYALMTANANGDPIAESLRPFDVAAGQTRASIDLCDPVPLSVAPPGEAAVSPAGLVFADADGLDTMDAGGGLWQIIERPDAALSPDGARALYAQDGDIWLADLSSGERRNLTNTPERVEHSPQWWPQRPSLIAFSSHNVDRVIELGPGVFPSVMQLDGSGYQVIDEESDAYTFALSPDGRTIAYGIGPIGWLYDVDNGVKTVFDPADYSADLNPTGASPAPQWSVASPAFSPDGRQMAWMVGLFYADGSNQINQGFFDLTRRASRLWHPYQMPGMDGVPPAAIYGPDSTWVAVQVWSVDESERGLWVVSADGRQEHHLGDAGSAVFSPDGRWLAYHDGSTALAVELGVWDVVQLPTPPNTALVGWR